MNITGIIVEYNPFTFGHQYHINQARELTRCDVLIAVMSANYVQRGEVAIIDKWTRAKSAVEMGVDLVIELPYIYSVQSASQFAEGAINILNLIGCNSIVFGSESNDLMKLQEIADTNINVDYLKESLKQGVSFVHSYSLLQGNFPPNDILAIAYLKSLKDSLIKPYTIKRTNSYHDTELLDTITSATSIRNSLYNNQDVSRYTPIKFDYYNTNSNYFNLIKHLLLTLPKSYLSTIFLVSEGIENHLIKCISKTDNYLDFIDLATTRRYTKTRIQRVLCHLINQVTTTQKESLPPLNYIRPLAFNIKGQNMLSKLREKEGLIIATRFGKIPEPYRHMEYKATLSYTLYLENDIKKKILQAELEGPIII